VDGVRASESDVWVLVGSSFSWNRCNGNGEPVIAGTKSVEGYSPLMRRLRRLAVFPSSLLVGAFASFVIAALVEPMLPGETLPGNRHEPPETRAYIIALLNGDGAAVNRLQLPRNVIDRAAVLKQFEDALKTPGQTLTFLGGSRTGPIGQFGYVLTVEEAGTTAAIPIILTTLNDKIWYLRGGSTGGATGQVDPLTGAAR